MNNNQAQIQLSLLYQLCSYSLFQIINSFLAQLLGDRQRQDSDPDSAPIIVFDTLWGPSRTLFVKTPKKKSAASAP